MTVAAVVSSFILYVIRLIAQFLIELGFKTTLHELSDRFLEQLCMSSMLCTFAVESSSPISARLACCSGVPLFLLAIIKTSIVVLFYYTLLWRFTQGLGQSRLLFEIHAVSLAFGHKKAPLNCIKIEVQLWWRRCLQW